MEKEQIKQAAKEHVGNFDRQKSNQIGAVIGEQLYIFGVENFEQGAQWRIDSVWHDASEKPKNRNAECLVEVKVGGGTFCMLSHFYHSGGFSCLDEWNQSGKIKVLRWAYVKDLLPLNEKDDESN